MHANTLMLLNKRTYKIINYNSNQPSSYLYRRHHHHHHSACKPHFRLMLKFYVSVFILCKYFLCMRKKVSHGREWVDDDKWSQLIYLVDLCCVYLFYACVRIFGVLLHFACSCSPCVLSDLFLTINKFRVMNFVACVCANFLL